MRFVVRCETGSQAALATEKQRLHFARADLNDGGAVELIVLAVVAGLSFAAYAMWRQSRLAAAERDTRVLPDPRPIAALTDGEHTIHALRPGDIVSHLGRDFLVEGVLTLNDDGRISRLCRMTDGGAERWLLARHGDERPLLLELARELAIEPNGPESMTARGLPFRLTERGGAQAQAAVEIGTPPQGSREGGRVKTFEYAAVGETRLYAVVWPSHVDTFSGERVAASLIEVLPGDGRMPRD